MAGLINSRIVNQWGLFWLVTAPISLVMVIAMSRVDLKTAEAVSSMIQLSVRCAVPLVYVVFAASAVHTLFPGRFGQWLLRNRKYLGIAFAAAMAWQGFFILWLVSVHTDYYVEQVYVLRDAIEGVTGYFLLFLMTVTSFRPGKQLLGAKRWKLLHRTGIYFLWAYAFSVYWWALFYYGNPLPLDYLYYAGGFLAWAARAAAWLARQRKAAGKAGIPMDPQPVLRFAGFAAIGAGVATAVFGRSWYPAAAEYLYGYQLTALPEKYLPYWLFEPFLSLGVIAFGTWLIAGPGRSESRRADVAAVAG